MSLAKKIFDGGISPLKTRLLYGAGLGLIIFALTIITFGVGSDFVGSEFFGLLMFLISFTICGSILALILHFILKITGLEKKLPCPFFILLIIFYLLIGLYFFYETKDYFMIWGWMMFPSFLLILFSSILGGGSLEGIL